MVGSPHSTDRARHRESLQLEDQAGEDDAAIARYRRILEQPRSVVALNNLAFALAVRRKASGRCPKASNRWSSADAAARLLLSAERSM